MLGGRRDGVWGYAPSGGWGVPPHQQFFRRAPGGGAPEKLLHEGHAFTLPGTSLPSPPPPCTSSPLPAGAAKGIEGYQENTHLPGGSKATAGSIGGAPLRGAPPMLIDAGLCPAPAGERAPRTPFFLSLSPRPGTRVPRQMLLEHPRHVLRRLRHVLHAVRTRHHRLRSPGDVARPVRHHAV